MSLSPDVRAGFPAFTQRFEGRVRWLYLDVKGLVTTAVGVLVDPVERAIGLSWRHDDGTLATEDEIRGEWSTVKAMPFGLRYAAEFYRLHDGLSLSDVTIDALALSRLDADVALLERTFGDLTAWPSGAQTALCSMAWAMGAGFPATWPKFTAACRRGDWRGAAVECVIPELGTKPDGRNAANVALFEAAAGPMQSP